MNLVIESFLQRDNCDIKIEKINKRQYRFGYDSSIRNDLIVGIIVKTLDFEEIKLKGHDTLLSKIAPGHDTLLSKIAPEHFIKCKSYKDSYISHFFHQPLFLCISQYMSYHISSSIDYELIYISNIDLNIIQSNSLNNVKALDFHIFRYTGGLFYPVEIMNNKTYTLTNDKYVKQLNYWFYENTKDKTPE